MNGLQVKELRKKLSLNQAELAELLEVSKRSVVNYENSEEISPRTESYIKYILEKKNVIELDEKGEMIPKEDAHVSKRKIAPYNLDDNLKMMIRLETKKECSTIHEKIFSLMERVLSMSDQMEQFKREVNSKIERKNIS